jgi:hypothetical protein
MGQRTEALLYVIEKLADPPEMVLIGVTLATLSAEPGWRGVTVSVDWGAFLGKSEAEILNTLAGYYLREAERLAREIADCPSEASQALAPQFRAFLTHDGGARAWAAQMAAEHWPTIISADPGHIPD